MLLLESENYSGVLLNNNTKTDELMKKNSKLLRKLCGVFILFECDTGT